MSFPQSLAAALVLIAVCIAAVIVVARAGAAKWAAYREALAEDTPDHYQGREADFDEWERPY